MRISDWSSDVCSSDLAGATATASADAILDCARAEGLEVAWVLDTHPHADHFSAAVYCGEKLGAPRAIGEKVREVQKLWQNIYCLPDLATDGSQWDRLFAAGDRFMLGEKRIRVMLLGRASVRESVCLFL